jgi:hypothetical protein
MEEEVQALVVDNGSGMCKAGEFSSSAHAPCAAQAQEKKRKKRSSSKKKAKKANNFLIFDYFFFLLFFLSLRPSAHLFGVQALPVTTRRAPCSRRSSAARVTPA